MILFPAIDLKNGQCVRLRHGDMSQATIFNDNPANQAMQFERQGFSWLHLVDLDGAFAGRPVNADAVDDIIKSVGIPVQLGGGIRTMKQIDIWLQKGVRRVILGTAALRDPDLVRHACRRYPGHVAVGIDAKNGFVAVQGWAETSNMTAIDLAIRFADSGVAAIIFTDIDRDGVLEGLNIDSTLAVARAVDIPVIASGGLASMKDIERLVEPDCQILAGAVSGRALYDGRIDIERALRLFQGTAKC